MRQSLFAVAVAAASLAACSNNTTKTDGGTTNACTTTFVAGTTTEAEIDTAFTTAANGSVLCFGAGTFNLVNTLQLVSQNDITVVGAGIDVTILDFTKQSTAGQAPDGLDANDLQDLTLYNLTIQNTAGDAFKVSTSKNVIFESVKAAWSTPAGVSNGPYGIYPVTVQNVLIENSKVTGSSDTGIYIGQSQNIVCRDNETYGNVAGIEVENSYYAEVYDNNSHDNTAGILVFDLPNLQQQGGHDIHIHDNQMVNNNGKNFATNGDIVSIVPSGTGFFVMANHDVEVDNNTVTGNNTIGMATISYYIAEVPITDPNYYPYGHDVWIHDNTVSGNGNSPDASSQIGLIFLAEQPTFPGAHAPDTAWDGIYDPIWAADAGTVFLPDGGRNPNPARVCFTNNGATASFVNLNICQLEVYGTDGGITCPGLNPPPPAPGGVFVSPPSNDAGYPTNLADIDSTDVTPFDCDAPTVAPVDAGLFFSDAGL